MSAPDSKPTYAPSPLMSQRIADGKLNIQEVIRVNEQLERMLSAVSNIYCFSSKADTPAYDSDYIRQTDKTILSFVRQNAPFIDVRILHDYPRKSLDTARTYSYENFAHTALRCGLLETASELIGLGALPPTICYQHPPHMLRYLTLQTGQAVSMLNLLHMLQTQEYEKFAMTTEWGQDLSAVIDAPWHMIKDSVIEEHLVRLGQGATLEALVRAIVTHWSLSHGHEPTATDAPYPLQTLIEKLDKTHQQWERYEQNHTLRCDDTATLLAFSTIGKLDDAFRSSRWQGNDDEAMQAIARLPSQLTEPLLQSCTWLLDGPTRKVQCGQATHQPPLLTQLGRT